MDTALCTGDTVLVVPYPSSAGEFATKAVPRSGLRPRPRARTHTADVG
jgi:hypothetical protein